MATPNTHVSINVDTYLFGAWELDISIYPWFALKNILRKKFFFPSECLPEAQRAMSVADT